jgi:protein-S-isoprenylcysteine O-methyltransferase Ste14
MDIHSRLRCLLRGLHDLSGKVRSGVTETTHRSRHLSRKGVHAEGRDGLLFAACIVLVILPPLDVRFGWSSMPWQVSVAGDALVAFSFCVFWLVSKVNSYAAANVRVEEGQQVISTGVYGLIRHPMYFGGLFFFIGTPLALGSWWTLLLAPVFLPILVARILNEERVLERGLPGYVEYTNKVRYRLIPWVW